MALWFSSFHAPRAIAGASDYINYFSTPALLEPEFLADEEDLNPSRIRRFIQNHCVIADPLRALTVGAVSCLDAGGCPV